MPTKPHHTVALAAPIAIDASVPAVVFVRFPELPIELRNIIWNMALPEGRTVYVRVCDSAECDYITLMDNFTINGSMVLANREANAIFEKSKLGHWVPLCQIRGCDDRCAPVEPKWCFFNPFLDTVDIRQCSSNLVGSSIGEVDEADGLVGKDFIRDMIIDCETYLAAPETYYGAEALENFTICFGAYYSRTKFVEEKDGWIPSPDLRIIDVDLPEEEELKVIAPYDDYVKMVYGDFRSIDRLLDMMWDELELEDDAFRVHFKLSIMVGKNPVDPVLASALKQLVI